MSSVIRELMHTEREIGHVQFIERKLATSNHIKREILNHSTEAQNVLVKGLQHSGESRNDMPG